MKILLIDDHTMFSNSLKYSLEREEEIDIVDLIDDIFNLGSILEKKEYDIILMDINLSKMKGNKDGLEVANEILIKYPKQKIVMLTGYDLIGFEEKAKKIGTKGFICKDENIKVLVKKLNDVVNGELIFNANTNFNYDLTEREIEIINLYCSGLTRMEVAKECNICKSSLATALNRIYEKLGVRNYQEMVHIAMKYGYVKPVYFK